MKRLLILASILLLGIVFTAFAQPQPGCCGQRDCKPGPECCGPQGPGGMGFTEGPGPMPMRREMMQEQRMMKMRHRQHMMKMMQEGGTRETVRGRVMSIEPRPMGARLMVESDSRLVPVFLGPGWGNPDDERKVERNDMVEITGKRIMRDGQPVLMAGKIEIDDGDRVITLRPDRPDREGPPEEHAGPPEGRRGPGPRPMKSHPHAY
jgi:hypothetical protein